MIADRTTEAQIYRMPRVMSSRGRIEARGSADRRSTLMIARVIDFPPV